MGQLPPMASPGDCKVQETTPAAQGMVFFYGSLPCTGGSPWTNVNKDLPNGSERIAEQQQLFNKLFKGFNRCIADAKQYQPSITFASTGRRPAYRNSSATTNCSSTASMVANLV